MMIIYKLILGLVLCCYFSHCSVFAIKPDFSILDFAIANNSQIADEGEVKESLKSSSEVVPRESLPNLTPKTSYRRSHEGVRGAKASFFNETVHSTWGDCVCVLILKQGRVSIYLLFLVSRQKFHAP